MEHRNISETLSKRDKKAIRRARAAFQNKSMVKKIPRDHMGLYACEPFYHGIQQSIEKSGVSSKERKESSVKEENVQLRSAQRLVFHVTLHKEGCREVKTYYPLCKKVRKHGKNNSSNL